MGLLDTIKSVFGGAENEEAPASRSKLIQTTKRDPVVRYVDRLLTDLIEQDPPTITIRSSTPPPAVSGAGNGQPVPSYTDVVNRFKFLANLNPMTYPEPMDRQFEWKRGTQAFVGQVRFEDRASDPFCTIELRRKG